MCPEMHIQFNANGNADETTTHRQCIYPRDYAAPTLVGASWVCTYAVALR